MCIECLKTFDALVLLNFRLDYVFYIFVAKTCTLFVNYHDMVCLYNNNTMKHVGQVAKVFRSF